MGVLGQPKDRGAAATSPTLTLPQDKTGFFENVSAGFKQAVAGPHSTRVGESIYEYRTYDDIIKQLNAEGEQGEDYIEVRPGGFGYTGPKNIPVNQYGIGRVPVRRPYRNPFASAPSALKESNPITALYAGGDRKEIDQIWAGVERVRKRKPDFLKQFPNEGALVAFVTKRRQQELQQAQAVTERGGTTGTVGAFVGGMAGSVASMDPENAVGAGFGTAAGKTFARTVIKRAVEGAGANAAAAVVASPGVVADAQRLGQEMTTTDVVHQVVQAAGVGLAFGTAHVVLPKIGEAVSAAADKVAAIPPVRDALVAASIRAGTVQDRELLNGWMRTHAPGAIPEAARSLTPEDEAQLKSHWEAATPEQAPGLFRDGKKIPFDEFAQQTMAAHATIDTTTPDERAAAHVVIRDVTTRETSPLGPDAAQHNEARLDAIARSLGVALHAPDLPTPAPVQTPTVRDRSGGAPRRAASYEDAVHQAEGTGKNPDSSADGHFQFTQGTWLEYAPRVADTKGMSRAQILALRHDLPTAAAAERLFRADNAAYLRQRGLEDSPGNLSLAHFLGKADAAKVLAADPSTPIERLVDPKSLAANRKVLAGKSASEVVAWAHKRIGAAVDGPVARADAVGEADPLDPADYAEVPYIRGTFKPDDLETDATLMQYKSGGDEFGVTGKLRDVTAWDPIMSSEILAWESNGGRRVVVDGHQRVGLAKRLASEGQDIDLPTLVLREADGITAAQARVLGALRNINLGTGTLLDNARVLRDAPQAAELLKGAEHRREIEGLSKLSYEAFGAAINDVIDPRIAAEIGRNAPDPTTHMAMVDLLAKQRVSNPREAATVVRQALADGFGTAEPSQLSLLGAERQQSLYVPIARIMAAATKRLRDEKRTFKVLAEKAGKIEAAGNVLDKTANASKVVSSDEAIGILEATAHSAGPVRDALIAAARAELSGTRRADAVARFLDDLAGIDLRAAARGASEDGAVREPSGETGSRDAAAEADRLLAESHGPELYDHAVAARQAAELFSDPVGEAAKAQTDLLDHDLRMDAREARREAIKAATTALADVKPGEFRTIEPFPQDEPGYHRFRYVADDGTSVGGNYTLDRGPPPFVEGFNVGDANNPVKLGPTQVRAMFDQLRAQHPDVTRIHAFRMTGARAEAKEMWIDLTGKPAKGEVAPESVEIHGEAPTADGAMPSNSLQRTASWVIRNKETREVIMETFDRAQVNALNTSKYEAVPIGEYLGSINGRDKSAIEASMTAPIEVYRGESTANKGGGYYSLNRDWAAQFTQRGMPEEVKAATIHPDDVYVSDPLPLATNEGQFDAAMKAAKAAGKKAFRVDEGAGEPNSIFVFDKSALRKTGAETLDAIEADAEARGVKLSLLRGGKAVDIGLIDTTKAGRGQGVGTEFMNRLTAWADRDQKRLTLSPDMSFGASSKSRLTAFYKRFGFVENKGRNKDFEISAAMYREPQPAAIDSGPAIDPAIAERQRQEIQLQADSPLRPGATDAEGTMGLALFDVADQPTFRLSDEGDAKPIHEIMREAEADELAAQALRDCLK